MSAQLPHSPSSLTEADRDRAASFAVGALPETEARAFMAHLEACPVCAQLVTEQRDAADALSLTAPHAPVSADLESRLFDRIRATENREDPAALTSERTFVAETPESIAAAAGASYFLHAEEDWQPTEVAGVWSRTLHVDAAADRAMMLFRMDPGASYPAHSHAAAEQCFVLQGDLQVGDVTMREGDFQFAAAGSEHVVQSTREGCTLLISTSLSDELL